MEGPVITEGFEVKLLHLPLKDICDMQEIGEKDEEYREITPYWCRLLLGHSTALFSFRNNCQSCNVKGFTHIFFHFGKRIFIRRIISITIGRGKTEWGAPLGRDVFIIKHAEVCGYIK